MVSPLSSHNDQVNAGIRKSLKDAGIPAGFIGRSLTALPDGARLVEFVKQSAAPEGPARQGKPIVVQTQRGSGLTSFYLLARAFHLSGVGCRVVTLAQLMREVEMRDYDAFGEHAYSPMLCVTRFEDPSDSPLTSFFRWQIEAMLLRRLDDARPCLLHVVGAWGSETGWWTPTFYHRINEEAETVSVSE